MIKVIVTTTINPPTEALKKFANIAQRDNWKLYIVGDKKTPNEDYIAFCEQYEAVTYLDCAAQEQLSKELSDLIGWNCIQRRNFGLLKAYQDGAEIIATIDDDNIPFDSWGKNCLVNMKREVLTYKTDQPVFDPLSPIYPHLWHRGFPIQLLDDRKLTGKEMIKRNILVQADLWDGDPDIDAVCRITLAPQVKDTMLVNPYTGNKIMPFNSQNTFLSRKLFPTYFLFPHIGRMDDIWAAYVTQFKFPDSVIFHKASVWQDRNPHDLSKDLEAEMIGYKNSQHFAQRPADWQELMPEKSLQAYDVWQRLFK